MTYVLENTSVDSVYLALIDDPKLPALEDLANIDQFGEPLPAKHAKGQELDEEDEEDGEESTPKGPLTFPSQIQKTP